MDAIWPDPSPDDLPIVSPDGTTVRFRRASLSDRLAAFVLDLFLTQLLTSLVALVFFLALHTAGRQLAMGVFVLVSFLLRNVYFAFFELLWSGQTIGKRKLRLRVIARDGGPLTGRAILARNLTREIETFLPLVALTDPRQILPLDPTLGLVLAGSWFAVFALLPALNREHLRCGDLIGGTVVVRMPTTVLLADVAASGRDDALVFTPEQLDIYGIEELHVLESVLRRGEGAESSPVLDAVRDRIVSKIGWSEVGDVSSRTFLQAFYEAQRAHLERKMLFGKRKRRKDGGRLTK